MAKKLPLIISTLTLFANGFMSPATTWATETTYSPDGPWSFEEMMAVENEVRPIIDEVCPNESSIWDCVYRYTSDRAYDESFIYYRVSTFGDDQFHILSLDPNSKNGKTTIEYYFNPENPSGKYRGALKTEYDYETGTWQKHFDDEAYTYTISKLYLYQVETGYNPAPVDQSLYPEVFASPHTRILYSDTKPEGADSLLPANQRGTLEIETVSYDAKYSNSFYIAFEDEYGKIHTHEVNFSNCHLGGELCKLQYVRDFAMPRLVNKPTYEEGYTDGYEAGLAAGQSVGYEAGFEDGYTNGKGDGYEAGQTDGYDEGHNKGYNSGYQDGHSDGLSQGRTEGYEYGHMLGRDEGWMEGYDNGYYDGLNDGYQDGLDSGYHEGYDNGYNNGYNNGFDAGYNTAKDDNTDEGEGDGSDEGEGDGDSGNSDGSDIDSGSHNNNHSNSITNENTLISNTNSISVGSKLARTPNTGSSTKENSSAEFTWWLGAIFALGVVVLIWLFAPKRKKTNKKS